MRADARAAAVAVHASAVAIDGRALLIAGPSRAGKSRLAVALVGASTARRPIRLVGDDRVILEGDAAGGLHVRPHPRIAGFIERRGLGLVAMPWCARAPLAALIHFDEDAFAAAIPRNLPRRRAVMEKGPADVAALLAWWHAAVGTARHGASGEPAGPKAAEVWNW